MDKDQKERDDVMIQIADYVHDYRNVSGVRWSMTKSRYVTDETAVDAEAAATKLIAWGNQPPGFPPISPEVTVQLERLQCANQVLAKSRGIFNAMDALRKAIEHLHRMLIETDAGAVLLQADKVYKQFGQQIVEALTPPLTEPGAGPSH